MSEVVVRVENVTKEYAMGHTVVKALRGVSLEIQRGEFLCIAGPSGSGKTTLLNLIGCLDKPTSGRVVLEGRDTSKLSAKELAWVRRQRLGFVFQTFNLVPVLTAYENVELPLLLLGVGTVERRRRVHELLEALGIRDFAHHRPDEMSGGQQQRVSIARALVTKPALVLADEPTANLDSETGKAIIELMHDLNKKRDTTFVFSTHDPKVMERASRVVQIRDGLISSSETAM
ncbi:MAG: ABC transporter ATP-binding protein [Candidatus Bipolaricaulota bacterium]|nr:ABC transporter ATP-binding protein [Candidatus Bipolaricaulota bacterium]MCS7275089.1 ABC transporter ATP-binding protein [Candidatus Bipolaricaulota bacterium]MDW8110417.1 ABC transporter ATP-binding protein [Candidatus Bipolaricaulota bacterium]MDW8329731.1 ABC transporter ATP-binding protein [Candidatus Bipolaricaulota bacterium]